jgi:DNA-binding response OmpR family regulator
VPTVLVIEDDEVIREALKRTLTELGHTVRAVGTALDGLREATTGKPALVILDIGLPDLDGATTLQMLRSVSDVPVIVASARGDDPLIAQLINGGADDYIVKPFSPEVFAARVGAVLRRHGQPPGRPEGPAEELVVGELRLDLGRRTAWLGDRPLVLTRLEFDLLAYLAQRRGLVVNRRELVERVWKLPYLGPTQTIDVHVSALRRKLGETPHEPRYLHTVRGVGLRLVAPL